jgi:hypothetical protein
MAKRVANGRPYNWIFTDGHKSPFFLCLYAGKYDNHVCIPLSFKGKAWSETNYSSLSRLRKLVLNLVSHQNIEQQNKSHLLNIKHMIYYTPRKE